MGIPNFGSDGLLPPGIHQATWAELVSCLNFTARRVWLLEGLEAVLRHLAAAGCERVYIDGSFVTAKPEPDDFDICWDFQNVALAAIDPVLQDLSPPRASQKAKFRGDILPNVIEAGSGAPFVDYFQIDRDGNPKGILAIDPRGIK